MDDAFREDKIMRSRRAVRYLSSLGFLSVVGFFAVGCTLDESPTIKQIYTARDAISAAAKDGAKEKCPEAFADLEQRYLKVRGVYYACNESEASTLAQQLTSDASGLLDTCMAAAMPANQPPIAQVSCPTSGVANQLLSFSAIDSSDPDGTITSYKWDYGDGTTSDFTFPRATHRYVSPGMYTVQMMAQDDKGATSTASCQVMVSTEQKMSISADVLFDFDKSELRPEGIAELEPLLQAMQADAQLSAMIVGHTDSIGTEAYNLGLSQRRAQAVANYFMDGGIAADRLKMEGRGESEPRASNKTREGRQQNRRVEITVSAAGL
jgi:outer membrane protein OmpA-like peptidoglycan-associated protein